MEGRESTARAREDQAGAAVKASDFATLHLMLPHGPNTDPKLPVYNYTLSFRPAGEARLNWGLWDKAASMPFTGTIEEARAAAAAFHQLMCIKHELEE